MKKTIQKTKSKADLASRKSGLASPKAKAGTRTKPATGTSKTSTAKSNSSQSASAAKSPKSVVAQKSTQAVIAKKLTSKKKDPISKATSAVTEQAFKLVNRDIAQQEMNLLCQRYPEAECELDFDSTFQLLTAVIMSAQTTDTNVNKVSKDLFARFPDAKSLAAADLDEIKEIIKSTGYYNAKATNIQNCAQHLVDRFGGNVPSTMEELITLPGVGRKTANVVLGVAFGVPGWTVDTHVQRLSMRLGFSPNTDPAKIETDLQELFPNQDWSKHSITLIWHGRRTCFARNPECEHCPINHLCPSSRV